MTHLQKGFQIAPTANLSEKDLTLISTQNVSRLQMAKFLKSVEDGKPVDDSTEFGFVQSLKTEGFVLRPEPKSGRWRGWFDWTRVHDVCIDGEMEEIENGAEIWVRPWDDAEESVSFVV